MALESRELSVVFSFFVSGSPKSSDLSLGSLAFGASSDSLTFVLRRLLGFNNSFVDEESFSFFTLSVTELLNVTVVGISLVLSFRTGFDEEESFLT